MKRERTEYMKHFNETHKEYLTAYHKDYYARNKAKKRAEALVRYEKQKDTPEFKAKKKEYHKKWYAINKEAHRIKNRARTPEVRYLETVSRIKKQEELAGRPKPADCEICGSSSQKICFDHDHKTGKFRGWICYSCNVTLGHLRDSVPALYRMIAYLEKNKGLPLSKEVLSELSSTNSLGDSTNDK